MRVDYHIAEQMVPSLCVSLIAAFSIDANSSYRVNHIPYDDGRIVMVVTLSGKGYLENTNGVYTLQTGDALFFQTDKTFQYHCIGEHWRFYWYEFMCEILPIKRNYTYKTEESRLPVSFVERCFDLLKSSEYVAASSLLAAMISGLATTAKNGSNGTLTERYRHADRLIRDDLAGANAGAIAKKLSVDERTLRNTFVACSGFPPGKYIAHIKAETAKYLLLSTNKSIGDISDELGYSSQFHFSRVFKNKYNLPPSEYRKKSGKKLTL